MSTLDFSQRAFDDELMDTELVSFEEFRACLRDLALVNRASFAYRPTIQFFERLLVKNPGLTRGGRAIEVIDVGSGYGDTLREIGDWAKKHDVPVSLTGIDLNPWSKRAASEATPHAQKIEWVTADAFAYRPPRGVDVVISSLFTHHLSDLQVVNFLSWMERTATLGWFVNDLHRHALPYHFFRQVSKALGLHRFVQHDGPVSIARAFSSADWRRLLQKAGIDRSSVAVAWRVPFRVTVERQKSP
jgi:SAM-dependent methyltransferase